MNIPIPNYLPGQWLMYKDLAGFNFGMVAGGTYRNHSESWSYHIVDSPEQTSHNISEEDIVAILNGKTWRYLDDN